MDVADENNAFNLLSNCNTDVQCHQQTKRRLKASMKGPRNPLGDMDANRFCCNSDVTEESQYKQMKSGNNKSRRSDRIEIGEADASEEPRLKHMKSAVGKAQKARKSDRFENMGSTEEDIDGYIAYLKTVMEPDLFNMLDNDVLSHIQPGDTKMHIESLVIQFLKSDDTTKAPQKVSRRRRTADREIIQSGIDLSTGSPEDNILGASIRRSKRLRKSLTVYKESSDIRRTQHSTNGNGNVQNKLEEDVSDAKPLNDATCVCSAVLESDDITQLEDFENSVQELTEELESLYRNKNFVRPVSIPLQTIFESPQRHKGELVTFSTAARIRTFDFSEGSWYKVSLPKTKKRKQLAKQNGWHDKSEKEKIKFDTILKAALTKLDEMCLSLV